MAQYTDQQIKAVREMQQLMGVPGHLTEEACIKFLDFWHSTCSVEALGITTIEQARDFGLKDGMNYYEMQFRKLSDLASA